MKKRLSRLLVFCMIVNLVVPMAFSTYGAEQEPTVLMQEEETEPAANAEEAEEAEEKEAAPAAEENEEEKEEPERAEKVDPSEEAISSEAKELEEVRLTATAEDGVTVIIEANDGVFPEGVSLSASVVYGEEAREAGREVEACEESGNVAKRTTYDICVLLEGEEVEPDTSMGNVKVFFVIPETPCAADGARIYHHAEDGLEVVLEEQALGTAAEDCRSLGEEEAELSGAAGGEEVWETVTEGTVVLTAEVDSFSYYTVDFTYTDKTVSIKGGSTGNLLSEIMAEAGITDEITDVEVYLDEACTELCEDGVVRDGADVLFRVYRENDTWYVDAVNAFQTEHGIIVYSGNEKYQVKVTDAGETSKGTPLTLTAVGGPVTVQLQKKYTPDPISVEYSKNGVDWSAYVIGNEISLSAGEYVKFRGNNDKFSKSSSTYYYFQFGGAGTVKASGDVTSLMNGTGGSDVTLTGYCFCKLFIRCTTLTAAPKLPANALAASCYNAMFFGCTALTEAPELKAETLAEYCYAYMFSGCSSLKISTECEQDMGQLFTCPANLTKNEVSNMFTGTDKGDITDTPAEGTYYAKIAKDPEPEPEPEPEISPEPETDLWTSAPILMGSAEAPVGNGIWVYANGMFTYYVNGEFARNVKAWITYTATDGKQYTGCFYFDKNGRMATGWRLIDGIWYYFEPASGPSQGIMYTNGKTPDGYAVDAEGRWVQAG